MFTMSKVNQWQLISPQQLQAKLTQESVILIDVRDENEYIEGHIQGAILRPVSEFNIQEFVDSKNIIIYCRSGKRSHRLAENLWANGWRNFQELEGGIIAWKNAEFPISC